MKRKWIHGFIGMFLLLVLSVCSFKTNSDVALAAESSIDLTTGVYEDSEGTYVSKEISTSETPELVTNGNADWLFAGWYKAKECTKANAYRSKPTSDKAWAKFVPAEVLSVKVQVTKDAKDKLDASEKVDMRMVSSVDGLNYQNIGFEVSFNGGKFINCSGNKEVSQRICSSSEANVEYNFSPKVVDAKSEYFITHTLTGIGPKSQNKEFLIRPYWVTLDGTTVYGINRTVKVSDSYSDVVSLSVKANNNAANNFTATVGNVECTISETRYTSGEKFADLIVSTDKDALASATKYEISDGTTIIHRNHYTTYKGPGTEDVSWYEVNKDAEEFLIATNADLYGLSQISARDTFAGKTVYVISDIAANSGTVAEMKAAASDDNANNNPYTWTPIGNESYKFAGTFDGQGHTISGIYLDSTEGVVGMFKYIDHKVNTNVAIQNFRLVNSYIATSNRSLGSIAGAGQGTIRNVYSSADVVSTYNKDLQDFIHVGGIFGVNTGHVVISNCWYAGTITSLDGNVGGIVGTVQKETFSLEHCSNSGTIICTQTKKSLVGGMCGKVLAGMTLSIEDSLYSGTIQNTGCTVKSFVGYNVKTNENNKGIVDIIRSYTTRDEDSTNWVNGEFSSDDISSYVAKANLVSYGGLNTKLDFTNYWTLMTDSEPVLKSFADAGCIADMDCDWTTNEAGAYEIETKEELYGMAYKVNTDAVNYADKDYVLVTDIELNSNYSEKWATKAPKYEWIPIGTTDKQFAGNFDGQNHTIRGLYTKVTSATSIGLFGGVATNVTIQNVKVENSYFENVGNTWGANTGAIVGFSQGVTLKNVYSNAIITTTETSGTKIGDGSYMGGLVGLNRNAAITIKNGWFGGIINGFNNYTGGILGGGYNATGGGVIENCLFDGILTGTVTGGAGGLIGIGHKDTTMRNCLSAGTNESSGVCGSVAGTSAWSYKATVTAPNTYATYECHADLITPNRTTAGAVQVNESDILGELAINGAPELDYAFFWKTASGKTPVLRFLTETVNVEQSSTWYDANKTEFVITTAKQLRELSTLAKTEDLTGKTFKLGNDIDLNPQWIAGPTAPKVVWEPIGTTSKLFSGNFDGQNHTIRGLYTKVTSAASIGLFGGVAKNVTIQNVKVENSYFENVGNVWGANTGAIVGFAQGTVLKNVYSNAIITTTATTNTNTGDGSYMGGLVGINRNAAITIQNGWFNGTINGANQYAGGILGGGYQDAGGGLIENCLFDGNISGAVSGGAGGLIGIGQKDTTMRSCLSTGTNECTGSGGYGSVAGTSSWANRTTVTAPNTYATKECHATLITSSRTVSGAVQVNEADILGAKAIDGAPQLLNTIYWKTVDGKTPVLSVFYTMEADTAWFDNEVESVTSYTISTANELYGLAQLSTTNNFAGKTIYLANDIALNETGSQKYEWTTPIGTTNNPFAGTFDGQGYTVSGLYINNASSRSGFFGTLAGTVQNLRLEDGSITTTSTQSGTVAGSASGIIKNVYSNIDLVSKNTSEYGHIGGIVGLVDKNMIISNCWYDGELTSATLGNGGIVGTVAGKITLTIEHCLNSGTISASHTASRTAGICGQVNNATVNIIDTLNVGKIILTGNENQAGSVIGIIDPASNHTTGNVTLNSVFDTREAFVRPTSQSLDKNLEYESYVKVTGTFHRASETDRFIGYFSNYAAFIGDSSLTTDARLDYTNYWALSKTGTPVLKSLTKESELYQITDANTELALTYWNTDIVFVQNAIDTGNGYYQVNITDEQAGNMTYNGYVATLKNAGFACVENTIDNTYSATCSKDEWNVTVTHVGGSIKTTYISFNTGQEHSKNLMESAKDTTVKSEGAQNKLHMLNLSADGNSMVVELKNGHFIVYDGGYSTELESLMAYLKTLAGKTNDVQNPVVIEAWVVSHFHSDHAGALGYIRNYSDAKVQSWLKDVRVEAIYVSEPNDVVKDYEVLNQNIKIADDVYNGRRFLKTTEGKIPSIYRMQTGQTYYFGDITMDVIYSQNLGTSRDMYVDHFGDETSTDFNDTSTWLIFNIDGEKILLSADGNTQNMDYIMKAYSQKYLAVDVFQAPHHGKNTYDDFTKYCTVRDYVLFENIYDISSNKNWYGSIENKTGTPIFVEQVVRANQRLVKRLAIGNKDLPSEIPYFYMNGKHTILAFTGTGITGTQVDIQ